MTKCPGIDTPGPSWYKLEAIPDETNEPVGEFEEPSQHTEAYTSKNNAVSLEVAVHVVEKRKCYSIIQHHNIIIFGAGY